MTLYFRFGFLYGRLIKDWLRLEERISGDCFYSYKIFVSLSTVPGSVEKSRRDGVSSQILDDVSPHRVST